MRSTRIHQLEKLQEEHCLKLFSKHAFLDGSPRINSDFKEIAKKIIEKCQGLPLALKTIGSLLYTKSYLVEWVGKRNMGLTRRGEQHHPCFNIELSSPSFSSQEMLRFLCLIR